jgi:putative CocE/NonD family hydrolase
VRGQPFEPERARSAAIVHHGGVTTTTPATTPAAQPRSRVQRLLDGLITRWQKLPAPTNDYTVTRNIRIPMRDGLTLSADLYAPTATSTGTVLARSPYGWSLLDSAVMGAIYASRGYHVVLVRVRGTFGSDGPFEPMIHEVDDGADTVAWLRAQPWFGGRFATLGPSYLGFTQWALLMDPPPELATAIIAVGPHDFHEAAHQGGAFNLNDFLGWSYQVGHQEDGGVLRGLVQQARSERIVAGAVGGLPLLDAGEQLLAGRSLFYRDWVSRRDPADPIWAPMRLRAALDRVQVPVLLHTGWQDLFLQQTLEQYAHLTARGVDVALTAGPWTHIEAVSKGARILVPETLDWLAEHLGGSGRRTRPAPIKVFVSGADQWRDLRAWPPPTDSQTLHLHADGTLSDAPAAAGATATFMYDPADPTPSIGGRVLARTGGYTDDHALPTRADVAVFTGAPLRTPLEVLGEPVIELAHSSDNPHADLFVRISEVDGNGGSRNVSEGFRRLDGDGDTEAIVRLPLDAVAHRFTAGHRIRVVVAGGSHPRWERNLGTGDDPATSSAMKSSHRTIDLTRSQLTLPVATW